MGQVPATYRKQLLFLNLNNELLITLIRNLPGMKTMPMTILFECSKVVTRETKRKLSVVADLSSQQSQCIGLLIDVTLTPPVFAPAQYQCS
jgi:hypothetical protein